MIGALRLVVGDRRRGSLRGQHAAPRLQGRLGEFKIGLCLLDRVLIGDRVDLEQQVALGNLGVLCDRQLDDPSADRGRDMDDVGIDRRVIGRGERGVPIQHANSDENRDGDNQQRDQLAHQPMARIPAARMA